MQIVAYVVVQTVQVGEVVVFTSEVRQAIENDSVIDGIHRQEMRDLTDLSTCLLPLGPRFSDSEELGISELAVEVTRYTLCAKWNEYTERFLDIRSDGMSSDEYVHAWAAIGAETVQSCEEHN